MSSARPISGVAVGIRTPVHAGGAQGGQRTVEALRLDGRPRLEQDPATGAPGPLADEHLPGRRRLLEAGGGVDRLARHREVAVAVRGQDLAGLDPDPEGETRVESLDPLEQGQRGADGPIRVVAMGDRDAEDRQHRVADVLLQGPSVLLEGLPRDLEERLEPSPHVLRVEPRRHLGRADQIGEDHRRDLSLRLRQRARAQRRRPSRSERRPQPRSRSSGSWLPQPDDSPGPII